MAFFHDRIWKDCFVLSCDVHHDVASVLLLGVYFLLGRVGRYTTIVVVVLVRVIDFRVCLVGIIVLHCWHFTINLRFLSLSRIWVITPHFFTWKLIVLSKLLVLMIALKILLFLSSSLKRPLAHGHCYLILRKRSVATVITQTTTLTIFLIFTSYLVCFSIELRNWRLIIFKGVIRPKSQIIPPLHSRVINLSMLLIYRLALRMWYLFQPHFFHLGPQVLLSKGCKLLILMLVIIIFIWVNILSVHLCNISVELTVVNIVSFGLVFDDAVLLGVEVAATSW